MTAMKEKTSVVRLLVLATVFALLAAACGVDTGQTGGEKPSTTGSPGGTDAAAGGGQLDSYRLGIFEDVTTDNLWNYNDTEGGTVWNQYLLATTSSAAYTVAMPGIEFVPDLAAG